MSQHDYSLADQTGASFRSDLNGVLGAIVTQNSGATEPSTMFAFQQWADTTAGLAKIRNAANTAWVTIGKLASVGLDLGFAAGTRMLFQQTAAPTGWTKETNAIYNDAALRFQTGTVATGGANGFIAKMNAAGATAGFTLTTAEIPSHTHTTDSQSVPA